MWLPSEVARLRAVSSFRQSPSWSRKESAKKKANIENCGSPRGTVGVSCSALTTSTIFLDDFFSTDFAEKEGLLVLYKKAFILVYLPRRFSSLSTMFTCSIKHVICILIGVAKLVPHTMLKSTVMSI